MAEAFALFGARHYNDYHFLLTLSDHIPSNGLEHHEASDNRGLERSFTDDSAKKVLGTLLSHEYVHSWNGKYRRPEGLVSGVAADYQEPVDSSMLWVYEGLTEYYGDVLGARSGLRSPELYRENLALYAAAMDNTAGRAWRPLEDTAVAAQLLYDGRPDWASWRRGVDFYTESELIWLEADTIIRQASGGQEVARRLRARVSRRARRRPGGQNLQVRGCDRDAQRRRALRLERLLRGPRAPRGAARAPGRHRERRLEARLHGRPARAAPRDRGADEDLRLFLVARDRGPGRRGIGNAEDGVIRDVVPGLPAAAAGIGPGMRIVAVNGRRYSEKGLREALRAAKSGKEPIELIVENVETFKTVKVDYHGGERYPHLERDASKPDLLSAIGKPLAPVSAK